MNNKNNIDANMNIEDLLTMKSKVILASSSNTRINYLRQYLKNFISTNHLINEKDFKHQNKNPEDIALELAKQKAKSLRHIYPNDMIIGSDQILVCSRKIIDKPQDEIEAKKNLLFLRNKFHKLYSAIYVIKDGKFYFKQCKHAELFFKNIKTEEIERYIKENKKTVLSSVGSYKIEENEKYKFIKIKQGDIETIIGFPINDFMNMVHKNG